MIQALQAIWLSPIAIDQSVGATGLLGFSAGVEWLLTAFAIVSLALSVALFFWVSAGHRRLEQCLTHKLTDSVAANARLRMENEELIGTNKDLQQTIAKISASQKEAQQKIAGAVSD